MNINKNMSTRLLKAAAAGLFVCLLFILLSTFGVPLAGLEAWHVGALAGVAAAIVGVSTARNGR